MSKKTLNLFRIMYRTAGKTVLILIVVSILSGSAYSQSMCNDVTLTEALKKYELGDFESVFALLNPCIESGFSYNEQVQAYRLLSLSYIAIDSSKAAYESASRLLKINPNFEPTVFDPPRFFKMVTDIKQTGNRVFVTSVSKKIENAAEAPATVIVVGNEEIKRRGYLDLEAVLSDLPGFDISHTYAATYSNIYQRGYRSNNTDRTIFLIDGVEENDLWSNIAYISRQYPISNLDRIEVVYGPASTMYGANAFVGVVNIITKNPDEITKGKSLGVDAHVNYGSWNTRYTDVTLAGQSKDVSFSLTGRTYLSDEMDLSEFPDYDYSPDYYDGYNYYSRLKVSSAAADYIKKYNLADTHPYYNIIRDNSGNPVSIELTAEGAEAARNKDKAGITRVVNGSRVRYQNITDEWLLYGKLKVYDFSLGFQTWKKKTAGTNFFTDNRSAGGGNGVTWLPYQSFFYLNYESNIMDNLVFSNYTQYKIHSVDNDSRSVNILNYSNGLLGLGELVSGKDAYWVTEYYYQISKQLRNESKLLYNPYPNFDMIFGIEIRNSQLQGNYNISNSAWPSDSGYASGSSAAQGSILGGNQYDIRDWGSYLQASYKPWQFLKITLGGRVDYNKIRVFGGYGWQFNPRIALVFTPSDFIVKTIYSEAMKDASNWTKFATNPARLLPSPNLEPEKVKNYEISLGYRLSSDLYAEVVGYNSFYSGVVGTKLVPYKGGTTAQNYPIGTLEIKGIQAQLNYKLGNYDFYSNYTYTDPKNTDNNMEIRIGDIASNSANLGINALFFDHVNVNFRINYIGEKKTGPGTTVPANLSKFPSHTIANVTVGYNDFLYEGITVQAICNNIFNKTYFDPGVRSADGVIYSSRTPQRERYFMLRVLFGLNY